MLMTVRKFLSGNITTLLIVVVVSLGLTTKWALNTKASVRSELIETKQAHVATLSELAQERRNALTLANALDNAERRTRELSEANTLLSQELSDAFQTDPEWSGGAVPDAVVNSLCQHLSCTPGSR